MSAALPADRAAPVDPSAPAAVRYPRASPAALGANLLLALLGACFLVPLLWVLLSSIDAHASWSVRLPDPTLGNYTTLMHSSTLRPLYNSLYLAVVSTVISTALAILAAYPLSRRHVPLKHGFLLAILFASGLPVTMMLVPVYQLFVAAGWIDSLFWTAMFLAASSLPFAIWLMKTFIDAVPRELEEAAVMEGTGTLQMLRRIVVPLTIPGICVTAIFSFINAWGAFVIPLVLNTNPHDVPGSLAVYQFLSAFITPRYGPLAAYSVLFSLPVLALYLAVGRRLSGAFTFGGGVRG